MKLLGFCAGLFIAATSITAAAGADENWRHSAHVCWEAYAQQWQRVHEAPCGSCSAGWQDVSRCTAGREFTKAPPWKVDWCIDVVEAQFQGKPMSIDRVAPVMSCLGGNGH